MAIRGHIYITCLHVQYIIYKPLTSQSFWMTCLFSGDSGLPGTTGDRPGDTPGDVPSNTSSLPTLTSLQVLITLALRPLPSLATENEAAIRSSSRSAASARSWTMSSKLLRIQKNEGKNQFTSTVYSFERNTLTHQVKGEK